MSHNHDPNTKSRRGSIREKLKMGSTKSPVKNLGDEDDGELKLVPIPQPSKAPFVGNLPDLDVKFPLDSMINLANKYGSIFKLDLPGLELVTVSDWDLVHEVCDDSRFKKSIKGDLEVREFACITCSSIEQFTNMTWLLLGIKKCGPRWTFYSECNFNFCALCTQLSIPLAFC